MFGLYAKRLYELGWNIIPVHGKKPIIPYWAQYSDIPPSKYEIQRWINKHSNENIGVVLGGLSDIIALDIDISEESLCNDIKNLAEEIFEKSPVTRYGRYPRCVLLYRGSYIKTSVGPVEFLSTGRQVVIFGKHPITKKDYYYEDFSPLEVEIDDLPLIRNKQADKFKELVKEYLPKYHKNGNGQFPADTDYFNALKDSRKAKSAHERRIIICQQLQGAEPGNLHNTLVSCVAALAKDGCSAEKIKQLVEYNFNAPKSGPYSDDWKSLDNLIAKTIKKFGNKNDIQRT